MQKRKTLYSALYANGYPFEHIFDRTVQAREPKDIINPEDGVLVIWGGSDIAPEIYGHKPLSVTDAQNGIERRDALEIALAEEAMNKEMPIIGVCRGAQLMCALSGGYLIQDVNNHTSSHMIIDKRTDATYRSSSLHHQMMYPWDIEHEIVAISSLKESQGHYLIYDKDSKEEKNILDVPVEPEIVYFPTTRCLGIQGHPEFMSSDSPFVDYVLKLCNTYLD